MEQLSCVWNSEESLCILIVGKVASAFSWPLTIHYFPDGLSWLAPFIAEMT